MNHGPRVNNGTAETQRRRGVLGLGLRGTASDCRATRVGDSSWRPRLSCRKMRHWVSVVAATWIALLPCGAVAQDADTQAIAASRTLAASAADAWNSEDYETAYDHFSRAYALYNAPTLAVRKAECAEKLGRLVDASETYAAAAR